MDKIKDITPKLMDNERARAYRYRFNGGKIESSQFYEDELPEGDGWEDSPAKLKAEAKAPKVEKPKKPKNA